MGKDKAAHTKEGARRILHVDCDMFFVNLGRRRNLSK